MKALKNESAIQVEQVIEKVTACYESNSSSNSDIMNLYYFIGKAICEQGEKAFVAYLADVLKTNLPELKGFSPRNLRRMRDFYKTYESNSNLMKKALELTWTQNTIILECCDNNEQRSFYLSLAKKKNLSKLALIKAIKDELYTTGDLEKTAIENKSDCCHLVGALSNDEANDTSGKLKTECRAFVPICKHFRQGIGASKIKYNAYQYIMQRKIDLWYVKMIYYRGIKRIKRRLLQSFHLSKTITECFIKNKTPI